MKQAKKLFILSLTAIGTVTMTGCDWFKKKDDSKLTYSFSIGLKSGASIIEIGTKQQVVTYDNGVDTEGRTFTYSSTNPNVATINAKGEVTPVKEGRVNFLVTEKKSKKQKLLKKEVVVSKKANASSGGYNFAGGTQTEDLAKRAEILGKLEKYAMDTHLTGITLFDNGGYVKYSDRVKIPTAGGNTYIQGYGFGVLSDGDPFTKDLTGTDGGQNYKKYYHTSVSQDSLKINMYSATGSQVSDLAGYISSSYWGTKMNAAKNDYIWYPVLATENVRKPIINESGVETGNEVSPSYNQDPIPMEAENLTGLYRKWRVYVQVDGENGADLKYTKFKPQSDAKLDGVVDSAWNGRGVALEDYLFAYKLLLTGSNKLIRGTEMANDTSYGIKGASRYYNDTQSLTTTAAIDAKWNEYLTSGKLGLAIGHDDANQAYIDIELINPIDAFTAKYTLSSNLVSPLPEEFFTGPDAISATATKDGTMNKSAEIYGTFNNKGDNAILDYTLCLGPYTLTKWVKNSEIVFSTNNTTEVISTPSQRTTSGVKWFEAGDRYKIPGVYFRRIDTSSDSEKNWKQLTAGNLDSAGVPTSKVKEQKGKALPTKGDATFKLNVNSCTQEQWDELFWKTGKAQAKWNVKPWMSNADFLDGLFYSIDRKAFADKRGVTPSVNYFSDAYQMRNSEGGASYNEYVDPNTGVNYHKEAVKGYSENYGFNKDKAIDCFRNAVKQLVALGPKKGLVLGESKEKPTKISIHIKWMYQTDIKEYGEDIKSYIESAFNNDAVCGGRVKLTVEQDAVTNWEDVYNVYMMQGRFDLGFGAISGNTYNPLNFLEVLKSDNSSGFTLNWGPDTSKIDSKNPIIYQGQKWAFDALWEVADHGGIVENGKKINPVKSCTANRPTKYEGTGYESNLYNGFKLELPVDFAEYDQEGKKSHFDVDRVDCYVIGRGNVTLAQHLGDEDSTSSEDAYYDRARKVIVVKVTPEIAQEVNTQIKIANGWNGQTHTGDDEWKNNPFIIKKLKELFTWELYYKLTINDGATSVNYAEVKTSDN